MIAKMIEELKRQRAELLDRLVDLHAGDPLWGGIHMLTQKALDASMRTSARPGQSSEDRAFCDGYRAALIDLQDQLFEAERIATEKRRKMDAPKA